VTSDEPEALPDRVEPGPRLTLQARPDGWPTREWLGLVWVGDAPAVRIRVWATDSDGAMRLVREHFGDEPVVSLWNEHDAHRQR